MLRITVMAMSFIALSAIALGQAEKHPPKFALKDVQGKTQRLSDYKGKVVLLNFWATWCAPCRAEMPDLVKWQREYKSRGLQIIGVTYPPQELAEVRKFTKSLKVNYPVVIGAEETKALFDEGDVLPITVVIDREGKVRETIQGVLFPEEFEQKIKPLLSRKTAPGMQRRSSASPYRQVIEGRHGSKGQLEKADKKSLLNQTFASVYSCSIFGIERSKHGIH